MTDYIKYKAEDFLQDDYFIHSVLYPTLESTAYWEKQINEGMVSAEEFNFAKHYISSVTAEKELMSELELNRLFKRIEKDTVKRLQKRRKAFFYGAAASIALILGVTLWLLPPEDGEDAIMYAGSQHSKINSEHIELILSDNEHIAIEEDHASIDYGQKGTIKINEKPLDKTPDNGEKMKETEFNRLNVPFGKRSSLTLEDGTHVRINAGSRIVYPATFDKDKREIYVDGEIYIDVAKETDRPFLVRTSGMQITVRGTSFNITAYESDEASSVVLVNGSVEVKSKGNEKAYLLKPNDMLAKQNDRINIKQVKAQTFVSWVDGMYICDYERLESILLRLSRYYNVKITIDNDAAELRCSGKLDLKDDIADVLNTLASTAPVVYEINENREYHFMSNPLKK
ncbi:MAG: FecR domain-containing protein [Tannerella sp.]|jgi:ferric-dicitrate binding protein FerR (iron transport regulator)|nr:FecR domain-containing protein [Tannerella sp.]